MAAALEAVVIGDRWLAERRSVVIAAAGGWQGGLLQVARACAQGDRLLPQQWQSHFQTLPDTAALLLNALPYLWLQADAYGHHRAAVVGWAAELEQWRSLPSSESPTMVAAYEVLFDLVCQTIRAAGAGLSWGQFSTSLLTLASNCEDTPLGPALRLVAQSQGEFAVVLSTAEQRGWAATEVALAGLLVGLASGRAGVEATLRQRWLLAYPASAQDVWQLSADDLEAIALDLHACWSGCRPGGNARDRLESPPFPFGIRV
ncbi:hypothetical protein C7293_06925 [filamentous cyanobacterium CCT1]|nr:hypothetical protein C7293_06925 [filamentous cyanobacterium CCT1]PSN75858.1 hypothetical protein C8B47_30375 [filamentous cyanobacterium CCP4]